jgi:hypothetical protein
MYRWCVPSRQEGRFAIVTNAGRDAVDAAVSKDERCWLRTAKSCGPDAPTLASSLAERSARRQWQKSPVTGESTKEAVKTIARETPGCPGEPVVTNSPCFFIFAREAAGASAPGVSRALCCGGKGFYINSGADRAVRTRRCACKNITGVIARTPPVSSREATGVVTREHHRCHRPA